MRIFWKIAESPEEQGSGPLTAAPPVQAELTSRPPGAHAPAAARGNRYSGAATLPSPKKTHRCTTFLPRRGQHTAVNHITPQPAARRGKYKNCGGVHFKVGKRLGMMNMSKTGSCMGRVKPGLLRIKRACNTICNA